MSYKDGTLQMAFIVNGGTEEDREEIAQKIEDPSQSLSRVVVREGNEIGVAFSNSVLNITDITIDEIREQAAAGGELDPEKISPVLFHSHSEGWTSYGVFKLG